MSAGEPSRDGHAAAPSREEVVAFLSEHHGATISDVEPLTGGFWSSAWGYRANGDDLVLRLGSVLEGFHADRAAMQFASDELPVPPVHEIGAALGMSYAISERRRGRFLEEVEPSLALSTGPSVVGLLAAMYRVGGDPSMPVDWWSEDPDDRTWRQQLLAGLVDDPSARVSGWRATIAADPELDSLYRRCEDEVAALVERCPERRDLVHGDLLHRNVLVSDDASRVNAVFSWKCSLRGDFLYDVAWCSFWGAWHRGIAAADVWERVLSSPHFADGLDDAHLRHRCYQLHIGATHLGWYVWTGDTENLRAAADRLAALLAADAGG